MEKAKNDFNMKNYSKRDKFLIGAMAFILLMVTGILPFVIELVVGLFVGIIGLAVGLVAGVIGLVIGLVVGAIGLVIGLAPIILPVAIIAYVVRKNRASTEKPKNDYI